MNTHLSPIAKTISGLVLASAMPFSAHAVLIAEQVQNFTSSGTVTANGGNNPTQVSNISAVTGTQAFGKFDPSVGVLTGVSVSLTGAGGVGSAVRTQTIGTGAPSGGGGSGGTGTGSKSALGRGAASSFTLTAPGGLSAAGIGGSIGPGNRTCSTTGSECAYGPISPAASGNSAVVGGAGNNAYVGSSGTVAVNRSYTVTAVTQRTGGNFTSTAATYTANWSGAVKLSYEYLAHGQVSFNPASTALSNSVNFGTWLAGSGPTSQGIDIYNRQTQVLATNQVNIDLKSVGGTGNTGVLSTDLVAGISMQNLAAGNSGSGLVTFDTSSVGAFSAQYNLGFGDDSNTPGAATDSLFDSTTPGVGANYTATLDITGTVVDHAAPSFVNVADPINAVAVWNLAMGIGGAGASTIFDIFNLLGDRVGLEFVGCDMSGDTAAFTIGLCGIAPGMVILPGDFFASSALFNMNVAAAAATYNFLFVDNTTGINGTPLFYDLTLNITGIGNTSVPTPGTLGLLAAGLFALRRRGSFA